MESWDKRTEGNKEQLKPKEEKSIPNPEKTPGGAELLLGLGLAVAGCYAAKKAWEHNVGGVKEKTGAVAHEFTDAGHELFSAAINKGKGELAKALGVDQYLVNKVKGNIATANPEVTRKTANYKEIIGKSLSGVGIDADAVSENINTASPEQVFPKSLFDLLAERDYRFAHLADVDPNFATEMKQLAEQSQEEIVAEVRKLDPETRGMVSAAFLSSEIIPVVDKGEGISVDNMTDKQVKEKNKELSEGPDSDKYGMFTLIHMGRLAKEKHISMGSLSEQDQGEVIRRAIKEFEEGKADDGEPLAENSSEAEKEIPPSDMELMKTEYRKLLLERGAVQRRLLAMMTEVLKANRK